MLPENRITRRSLLFALPALRLAAQTAPTFAADVKVVNVLATVRNKQGQIVSNLNQDDFTLAEDGHSQVIRYFSRETDLPLTLGLLVDTSQSQRRVLSDERDASHQFFQDVLREDKDQAFVIHFDREVELLQDLTPSRKKLEDALNLLQIGRPREDENNGSQSGGQSGGQYPQGGGGGYPGGGGIGFPGGGRRYPGGGPGYPGGGGGNRYPSSQRRGGGTMLYDAVLLASEELMAKQKGRKAIVVLSDGRDRGSKVSQGQAVEAAQRADTLVYSIYFADEESGLGNGGGFGRQSGGRYPESGPDGKKVLQQIAAQTGGGFFEVSKKQTVGSIYGRIQEELRNQYSLGYTSDQGESGTYRKIAVTVKPKGLTVQARDGYYADNRAPQARP
ncbi:MAG TPA: VWA domain-containing protein [Bryobacteraceae bacterium]|jgi:VWFA-related protein|nr:VWA domain-containing protein [Bryobacteraceae bacterium]